jgi:hypothetical protein
VLLFWQAELEVEMHRLIREDEEIEAFGAFAVKHGRHLMATHVRRGPWSLVLHCPKCHDWQTYQIDNEARREALGTKGTVEVGA